VKIIFDTQDERIKPGMSVSAAIITDVKQDVLIVPNAAVKTSGEISYVEMPDETVAADATTNTSGVTLSKALKQQAITIGLANDSVTEVTEGLNEGDVVISRTISSSSTTATKSSGSSLFQMGGPGR
jgi:HlyD family secretion protein